VLQKTGVLYLCGGRYEGDEPPGWHLNGRALSGGSESVSYPWIPDEYCAQLLWQKSFSSGHLSGTSGTPCTKVY